MRLLKPPTTPNDEISLARRGPSVVDLSLHKLDVTPTLALSSRMHIEPNIDLQRLVDVFFRDSIFFDLLNM